LRKEPDLCLLGLLGLWLWHESELCLLPSWQLLHRWLYKPDFRLLGWQISWYGLLWLKSRLRLRMVRLWLWDEPNICLRPRSRWHLLWLGLMLLQRCLRHEHDFYVLSMHLLCLRVWRCLWHEPDLWLRS